VNALETVDIDDDIRPQTNQLTDVLDSGTDWIMAKVLLSNTI